MTKLMHNRLAKLVCFVLFSACAHVQGSQSEKVSFPQKLLWGDTHMHSSMSADAFAQGNTFSPKEAYELAMGKKVKHMKGMDYQLDVPLDFLVAAGI